MKNPLAALAFVVLAGCVSAPPIHDTNDSFAESYATVSTLTSLIASGERNGLVKHEDAITLYKRIREANDDIYAAQAIPNTPGSQTSLAAAQAILNEVKRILTEKGVSHE